MLDNTEYTLNICSEIIQLFSCDNTIVLTSHSLTHDYGLIQKPCKPPPSKIKISPLLIFLLIKYYTFTVKKKVKRYRWAKRRKLKIPQFIFRVNHYSQFDVYILPNLLCMDL